MSCEKRLKGRFQDPKIKTLLGKHALRTPLGWAALGASTFPLRERTPSKSHVRPPQDVHFSSFLGIYNQASARLENG